MKKTMTLLLAVALALSTGLMAAAQQEKGLSKKEASKALKEAGKALGQAQKSADRGDGEATAARAREYAALLQQLGRGMGANGGDELENLDVAMRVHEATLKHIPVLEGVLAKVPDQAKPAIQRALEASLQGNTAASQAVLRNSGVEMAGQSLDDRSARAAMRKNEALVKLAEASSKRGDHATSRRAVEQYAGNISAVGNAVQSGHVNPSDAQSVYDRVSSNTMRHSSKLEELLGTVPEDARRGIETAIEASKRGHQEATAALQRSRAADMAAGRGAGRPEGVGGGAPSGVGGAPSGVGGGPPSGVGGPPSGTPAGGGARPGPR